LVDNASESDAGVFFGFAQKKSRPIRDFAWIRKQRNGEVLLVGVCQCVVEDFLDEIQPRRGAGSTNNADDHGCHKKRVTSPEVRRSIILDYVIIRY
jgi:hypothetical protein